MDSKINDCEACRICCRFNENELYLAPLMTKEEVKKIEKVYGKFNYKLFKNSKNIFQIQLVKSKTGLTYDCPLLDERTHKCKIYTARPMDCKIWPFTFMKDKENRIVLAYFDNMCNISEKASSKKFKSYIKKFLSSHNGLKAFIQKNKGLALEFDKDAIILKYF